MIENYYIHTPRSGVEIDGRKGNWNTTCQPPSILTKFFKLWNLSHSFATDRFLGSADALQYKCEVHTFFPIDRFNVEGRFEAPTRLGTLANRHLSYQENLRKNARMEMEIGKNECYKELCTLANAFKPDICDAFIKHYQIVLADGIKSDEQGLHYFVSHKDSSFPYAEGSYGQFIDYEPKVELSTHGKKSWKVMLTRNVNYMHWVIKQLEKNVDFGAIRLDGDHIINAIRNRPAEYELINASNDHTRFLFNCLVHRFRSAFGVKDISQDEVQIFDNDVKSKSYQPLYEIQKKISNLTDINFIDELGVKFYLKMPKEIQCLDVNNAEKICGNIFPFLPFNGDTSDSVSWKYWLQLLSGVGKTRVVNGIAVSLIIRYLKDKYGYIPAQAFYGGDNLGLYPALSDEILSDLKAILDVDERILGWNPVERRIGGVNFTIDGAASQRGLAKQSVGYQMTQPLLDKMRALMNILQYDWAMKGDCEKFFTWVDKKGLDSEIYSHNEIESNILHSSDEMKQDLLNEFNWTVDWTDLNLPIFDNPGIKYEFTQW